MNLRWLLFDYADRALPLTFWHRLKIAMWRPYKLPRSMRRARIMYALVFISPMAFGFPLINFLMDRFAGSSIWAEVFIVLIPFLVVSWIWQCIGYGLLLRSEHYYHIRLEGFDVCLCCGYWLRGLDETIKTCPECGTEREAFSEDKQIKAGPE